MSATGTVNSRPSISKIIGAWPITITSPVGQLAGLGGSSSESSFRVMPPAARIVPQREQASSPGRFTSPQTGQVRASDDKSTSGPGVLGVDGAAASPSLSVLGPNSV